jgi:hypothetical protein
VLAHESRDLVSRHPASASEWTGMKPPFRQSEARTVERDPAEALSPGYENVKWMAAHTSQDFRSPLSRHVLSPRTSANLATFPARALAVPDARPHSRRERSHRGREARKMSSWT